MWRRGYLLLLLLRVLFAISPSYLHPDEVFQGPEVIAGIVYPYPSVRTWEWTVEHPIRSVFPLWPFFGLPMVLLRTVWGKGPEGLISPISIYRALRIVMFVMSFVLEDWAIYELVLSPKRRRNVAVLVASSYVTWTFQTHTFSNSIETLLVLWALVLIEHVLDRGDRRRASQPTLNADGGRETSTITSTLLLGALLVLGVFNRITFPAYLLIPGLRLLPHFLNRPASLFALVSSVVFWSFVAISTDTAFYGDAGATASFRALFEHVLHSPVITPVNSLLYNTKTSNLRQHGLHPRYQHVLVNLPQLLGPAFLVLLATVPKYMGSRFTIALNNPQFTSAAGGILILSIVPHQEPRFLLPCIPLLLTCTELPRAVRWRRYFWTSWVVFNLAMSVLMGIFHQGGVIPAQAAMPELIMNDLRDSASEATQIEVFWWKTYPPPTYLLGPTAFNPNSHLQLNITTTPLLGMNEPKLSSTILDRLPDCHGLTDGLTGASIPSFQNEIYLAAPFSAWRATADAFDPTLTLTATAADGSGGQAPAKKTTEIELARLAKYRRHVNLDDVDLGDDGFGPTIARVIGDRGLGVWKVKTTCHERDRGDAR